MKKKIELEQDFIDKIVYDELVEYRSGLQEQLCELYAIPEREGFENEDIVATTRSLAALDILISDFKKPEYSL